MTAERRIVFTPELRAEIERRLVLSAVIGERVELTETATAPGTRVWRGRCPFHANSDGSATKADDFRVFDKEDMTRSHYHCFGCDAHGSLLGFTMRSHNLSLPDAIIRLAEQAEIPVEWETIDRTEPTPEERARFRAEIAALHDPKTWRDGWGRVKRETHEPEMKEF